MCDDLGEGTLNFKRIIIDHRGDYIGLVLGPSTALYGPFLKHCILTNKVVRTI